MKRFPSFAVYCLKQTCAHQVDIGAKQTWKAIEWKFRPAALGVGRLEQRKP